MGCTFCRTAGMGFHRNLTSGEIVEQHLAVTERFGRPTNIVFMGMGEPLLNSEAVFDAASVFAHPLGPALPFKRITISTCGIPEGIERLAQASFLDSHGGARPRLAVSLLTAEPALRAELMPGATRAAGSMRPARTTGAAGHRRSAMSSLARALSRYQEKTGRSITIEVPLLGGINDSTNDAAALCAFLDRLPRPDRVDVNLIRWNPVEGLPFHPPLPDAVAAFAGCVIAAGYPVTGRYPRGRSIAAACGQLGTRPRR
jgi:23S rRNA (adenine2503-C2)-methyltransferase